MNLSDDQIRVLLAGIKPHRVSKDYDGHSHVEAYDIRAMLIRVFGYAGWSLTNPTPTELVYERETTTKNGKPAFDVAYRAHVRLQIGVAYNYDGSAVGSALMPDYKRADAHDMAIKTAESQALKRAAINLGDQFGLSLYNNGSLEPLVRKVVGWTDPTVDEEAS